MSIGQRITPLVLTLVAVLSAWSADGWQPARQLAFSPIDSQRLAAPAVYSEGDHVMVVYQKEAFYFIESTDGGLTWSEPVDISGGPVVNRASIATGARGLRSFDLRPSIVGTANRLLVVWHGYVNNRYRIFMTSRPKNDKTWVAPRELIDPGADTHAFNPRLVRSNRGLFLFWYIVLQPPASLGKLTTQPSTDMFIDRTKEGPESINLEGNFMNMGRDTRSMSVGVNYGAFDVNYVQVTSETVVNPKKISLPTTFAAFTDHFGNLYCSISENLQVNTHKYSPSLQRWGTTYDISFRGPYLRTVHFCENSINEMRIESGAAKVFIELLRGLNSQPQRISDPLDLSSIPDFWLDRQESHAVFSRVDGDSSWIGYVRSDHTPPTAKFTEPAGSGVIEIAESPFWIRWEGSDNFSPSSGLVFRHRFSDGGWSEWKRQSGVCVVAPPDRTTPYNVELQARDEAGNTQTVAATLRFDVSGVAPETFITSGRENVVVAREHTFGWAGRDNTSISSNLAYQWRLDEEPWSSFGRHNSAALERLREGAHIFQVRSKDEKENVDPTPGEFPFEVSLGIECFFPAAPGVITNQPSFPLKWACRDDTPDVVAFSYQYQMDGGAWSTSLSQPQFTFAGLSEGRHRVSVRGLDEIGNMSRNDLSHSFTVDLTPPDTMATTKIALNAQYEPMIILSASDNFTSPARLTFRYSLDGDNWQPTPSRDLLTVPRALRPWTWGYKVYVAAVDDAGNIDPTPAMIDYTFIARFPVVSLLLVAGLALLALSMLGMMLGNLRHRRPSPILSEEDLFGGEASTTDTSTSDYGFDDDRSEPSGGEKKKADDDDLFS